MIKKINKIVISTGGTGGHIFPAYGLAKHLIDNNIDVEIISDLRGLKYLKKYRDLKITKIMSSTIIKKNILKFTISISIIIYAFLRSFIFLLFNRPHLVFGMGGYSSFPFCLASKFLRVPFIIYENNLQIGKANKYLLPFAEKIFVSNLDLEGVSSKYKKRLSKIGNIIREEFLYYNDKSIEDNENKDIKILILGGSQAARIFAEKLPDIFKECIKAKISLKIYQQCLPEQNEFLSSFYKKLNLDFEIFNFSDNILEYFSRVDIVITRAGASILAELINARKPFISIPLPTSADNHQLKNAIYYKKNDYSYLVEEKDLNKKLFKLLKSIYEDKSLLEKMISKQKNYSDKFVYKNIDIQIEEIINEKY